MKNISFLLVLMFLISGCSSQKGLKIEEPWARTGKADGNSAAYFVLENNTDQGEKLLAVKSSIAKTCELHETKIDDQNKMMMMPQEFITIPAGGKTELAPGGLHIMMLGLKEDLKDGEIITITLQFEQAGNIDLEIPVKQ